MPEKETLTGLDWNEITKILIAFVTGVLTIGAKMLFDRLHEKWKAKDEIETTNGTSFQLLAIRDAIGEDAKKLIQETQVDRVLGLTAVGRSDYEKLDIWLSIDVSEDPGNAKIAYSDTFTDAPYRQMLHNLKHVETELFEAKNLTGILFDYYMIEKVIWSVVGHLHTIDNRNHKEVVYMSTATHRNKPYSEEDRAKIDLFFRRCKGRFADVL